jgi:phosphoribosylaminoimidazolecarboxamide formyltransferase/IMP cyclohydrolase
MTHRPLRRALLSLSDKSHLKELCVFLHSLSCEMVASSSTRAAILELGFPCLSVESLTQTPEMLGGRVKTLHPAIFGSILACPTSPAHQADLLAHRLLPFDLVVCNLYPFQEAFSQLASQNSHPPQDRFSSLIDQIDIGGVSLLRAAAKNHEFVSVLCDPIDYQLFIDSVDEKGPSFVLRRELAKKAFRETALYDGLIASAMEKFGVDEGVLGLEKKGPVVRKNEAVIAAFPDVVSLNLVKKQDLRYGENPHQSAAFYAYAHSPAHNECSLATMQCFHGKELSYNNMLDIEHSLRIVREFEHTTPFAAVIVKHNTPCGVGLSSESLAIAYQNAFKGDPVSPFGGIVTLSCKVTKELAGILAETFLEVILAPGYDPEALLILQQKKNLRLVTYTSKGERANDVLWTPVQGGFLAQKTDDLVLKLSDVTIPTILKPSQEILNSLQFAMTVVKHVRSNAIVIANAHQTISVAGGFTNRRDAVEHALKKAHLPLQDAVLASDGFFPFADSIELLKNSGISFVIQPGGSIQDKNVIDACDKARIGMVLTKMRHFKH